MILVEINDEKLDRRLRAYAADVGDYKVEDAARRLLRLALEQAGRETLYGHETHPKLAREVLP